LKVLRIFYCLNNNNNNNNQINNHNHNNQKKLNKQSIPSIHPKSIHHDVFCFYGMAHGQSPKNLY
jgi:hypothetical protein